MSEQQLDAFDAEMLTITPETADYFEAVYTETSRHKQAANPVIAQQLIGQKSQNW